MKLFQLLPKKLYDFACNLPKRKMFGGAVSRPKNGERRTENGEQNAPAGRPAKL